MTPQTRLLLSILSILAVVAIGSAGYMVIERDRGLSVLDAVYMTVITVSTVGYSEMWQPSFESRVWTLGVIEHDRSHHRRSLRLAERALALRPGYPQALALRAMHLEALGEAP